MAASVWGPGPCACTGLERVTPPNGAYTLVLTDKSKQIYKPDAAAVTVPPASAVVFDEETLVTIVNPTSGNMTITPGSGVTLRLAGTATTGARTIAQYGVANLLWSSIDVWLVGGAGVT